LVISGFDLGMAIFTHTTPGLEEMAPTFLFSGSALFVAAYFNYLVLKNPNL
jgi:hypothetical protein